MARQKCVLNAILQQTSPADVVRHYQEYLHHRRTHRPEDEYRSATAEEWTEFEEHFDKRRVELGSCARPYGTPCQHEHACFSELHSLG